MEGIELGIFNKAQRELFEASLIGQGFQVDGNSVSAPRDLVQRLAPHVPPGDISDSKTFGFFVASGDGSTFYVREPRSDIARPYYEPVQNLIRTIRHS